jgi:hypothetical protein
MTISTRSDFLKNSSDVKDDNVLLRVSALFIVGMQIESKGLFLVI